MEVNEEKALDEIFQTLVRSGIIRENFTGSVTLHINQKEIASYDLFQKKRKRPCKPKPPTDKKLIF